MKTVTVTIGRNVGDAPMDSEEWTRFAFETRDAVVNATTELWASAPTKSVWQDMPEEGRVFYGPLVAEAAARGGQEGVLRRLRARLATLATYHRQEAIGLSVGESELVESFPALVTTEARDNGS